MGLRINQNIAAQNAYRNLSVTDGQMSKSLEKLSSGFRINRAADDAAGLSISEGLRAQTGGLKVAVRNAQDGISVAQTAEGALNEVTSMLQRMRDLAVQSSNSGTMDTNAKAAAKEEFAQLNAEVDRIGSTTSFGKSKLLDGSFGNTFTATPTGVAVTPANLTAATAAAAGPLGTTAAAAGWTFDLTEVGGVTLANLVPPKANVTVTVAAVAADASAGDVAKAINDGMKTALKASGFQGSEVTMAVSTAANGTTGSTFTLTGAGKFTAVDTGGVLVGTLNAGLAGTTAVASSNTGQFQVGANANSNERINIAIAAMSANALGTSSVDLTTDAGALAGITAVDSAISTISSQRSALGAYQNRFEHTINNLNVTVENLSASESRIRDTDMAQEMVGFTRNQILTQAGTAMLSQANQASQNVLSLLR